MRSLPAEATIGGSLTSGADPSSKDVRQSEWAVPASNQRPPACKFVRTGGGQSSGIAEP
jgi:hypothetical protein